MRSLLAVIISLAVTGCDSCETCDPDAELIDVEGIWTIEGDGERAGCDDPELNGEFELGPSLKLAVEVFGPVRSDVGVSPRDSGAPILDQVNTPSDLAPLMDSDLPQYAAEAGLAEAGLADSRGPEAGTADSGAVADGGATDGGSDLLRWDGRSDGAKDSALSDIDHGTVADGTPPRDSRVRSDAFVHPAGWNQQLFRIRGGPSGFSLEGEATGTCITFETREESGPHGTVTYTFSGIIKKSGSSSTISGTISGRDPGGCMVSGDFVVEIR